MADSQSDSNVFSVRIVSIDYYMAPPIPGLDISYSSFQGGKVNEVPVIRVYGSTPAGQKTCLHIHRALPYLYTPCEDVTLQPHQRGDTYTQILPLAIEKALKLKGSAGSKRQHVHDCSIVKAKKFYGYHSSEELFAKIYLYYPQDVSRAANLLLGGAVSDKSLQPHESHIPFLLQFLVDYNLCGMGHLHVSSMKFRHPVPDVSPLRKTNYNGQHGQATDNSPRMIGGSQADSSGNACSGSPVWISSTIPDVWMWQPSSQPEASSEQNFHLVKRQSICELEGDIIVDDILNQQFKMYSSLSQTCSDVKMVQSLIPIWEEEHERTGISEANLPSDPGKPLPENVLRNLSHGLGFENIIMDLCNEVKNAYPVPTLVNEAEFPESTNYSINEENVGELGPINCESDNIEAPKNWKASTETGFMLPLDQQHEGTKCLVPVEGRNVSLEQLSADEIKTSDTMGTTNQKVADKEALGLLRWLASSQAAEDIHCDDELVSETILCPLLPTTCLDKVMEKANMDYESESQQECQDILDSIEDLINFDVLNKNATNNSCSRHTSKKIIPQVDGSSDDPILNAGETSKTEVTRNLLGHSPDQVKKETEVSFTVKHESNNSSLGPLPLLSLKKANNELHHAGAKVIGGCSSKNTENVSTSQAGNEADKFPGISMSNLDRYVSESNALVGYSVRGLMRRKRCYRVESPESEPQRVKRALLEDEQQESFFSKRHEFPTFHDYRNKRPFDCTSTCPSLAVEFQEGNLSEATCVPEGCGEACQVKLTDSDYPVHDKLPLHYNTGCILSAKTSTDECLGPCRDLNDDIRKQASARTDSIAFMGPPPLNEGTQSLPHFLSSNNQISALPLGECEDDNQILPSSDVNDEHLRMNLDMDGEHLVNERLHKKDITDANSLSTSILGEILSKEDYICNSDCMSRRFEHSSSEISSKITIGTEAVANTALVQSKSYVDEQHGSNACLSGADSSKLPNLNSESDPLQHICMTFHTKPPNRDLGKGTCGDSSYLAVTKDIFSGEQDSDKGISGQGKVGYDVLPFFGGDFQEEKEIKKSSFKNNEFDSCQEGIIGNPSHCQNDGSFRNSEFEPYQEGIVGVPTHYQNDGTYLLLLTTVFSPPSIESVSRWISHVDRGIAGDKVEAAKIEHSSSNGPSGGSFDSQGLVSDNCKKALQEFGLASHVNPVLGRSSEPAHGNYNSQINISRSGATAIFHNEGTPGEVKECPDHVPDISQISGPEGRSKSTPVSQIGFRDPASVGCGQQLTLMSVEVQAESRGDLRPDPRFDAVNVIALAIQEDKDCGTDVYVILRTETVSNKRNVDGISGCKVLVAREEKILFNHFTEIIGSFDPDIIMGWDVQGGSLGFLAERALHLGISLINDISRTPSEMKVASPDDVSHTIRSDIVLPENLIADSVNRDDSIIDDEWGRTHASGLHVGGRHVLNIWRLMRGELKLNMYTVESVAETVLREKVPFIHCKILTKWFSSGSGRARHRCIQYVLKRANLNLEITNQLDMINRTSELARIFGIDFFSVLSRGSQYRVESMFLRLAHTQNYLAISPGNQQVASQPAMECIPLVMEPESGYYADPVVVLDFQALYPSMIIAYNLCFCTCLGNVVPAKANTLGVSTFSPDPNTLCDLKDDILLTPNGVMYVSSKVRRGVLPRLLEEILSTRIMVKGAMKKLASSQQVLHRIFNARQLALKLIANVTYGYTAAGFSGRMPCAELADSIVQCGRRTLESAISFVNSHDKWRAKVIYGDTDSMFVLLKGRTKGEAFQIGHEIASAITAMNPYPVTLKMEKVYCPCFLLTKKRYVGYSYESPDQIKPVFDAKGIETVRRDTCNAVSKTMEKTLRVFFECQDISKVKAYLQRQWTKILSGRISIQDFVFAKEVRLGTYSTRASSSLPPAAIVASKAMRGDPRAEPRYGERIPYVVVHGEPGSRLVDMVVDPQELLAIDSPFRLNDLYYINKQIIPALQRVFGLVRADLNQWFSEMPRSGREAVAKRHSYASNLHRTRIDSYYLSRHCIMCGDLVQSSTHLCSECVNNEAAIATAVIGRTSKSEREIQHLVAICRECGGGDWITESGVKCTSLACTVFYERRKVQKELKSLSAIAVEVGLYPSCMVEWF